MKTFFVKLVCLILLCPAVGASAQMFGGRVDDLALIWVGGRHRPDWNKELFTPYLVHEYPDGHKSWLFDGFLMIEGLTNGVREEGESYEAYTQRRYTFGEANLIPANKEMWEWLLHRQLGTYDNLACRALDDRIGELLPELGEPSYKHQVVMMLPISYQANQIWGTLNGRALNFNYLEDKVAAMKWYVDLLLEEWEKADFKHVELAGIYWLRESIADYYHEVSCVKAMCEYAHEKDLEMYWIPYYRAPHYQDGRSYGIDMVYHQPNYVFDLSTPYERLTNSIDDAYEYDLGMLMEFEGCCISGIDDGINDNRTLIHQGNSSMYGDSKAFYQRFLDYIEAFEENSVFDLMHIGYYAGYQAVYDFVHSDNPKDQEIINRLASHIEKRHIESQWYIPEQAGIGDVVNDNKATVYGLQGAIYVSDVVADVVEIYGTDGRAIEKRESDNGFKFGTTISCQPGIYIVKAGSASVKVAVK